MTPREVFERLSQGISEGRWTELGALYAEDTVVEHPQRPPTGSRIVGRRAVAERFAAAGQIKLRARDVVIHETTDPEVIVAEFTYDGLSLRPVPCGGTAPTPPLGASPQTPFTSANIQVLRVRDGLIVHSRDYHDYLRMAAARDGLSDLARLYENSEVTLPSQIVPPKSDGVIERLLLGFTRGTDQADLYAEDAYVTHPFHPNMPPLKGREDIRAHFAAARGIDLSPHNFVQYQTLDPEVVVTEFDHVGTSSTGRPVVASNIFVTRIRDGLIVESRDYGDHLAFAAASGTLPTLLP